MFTTLLLGIFIIVFLFKDALWSDTSGFAQDLDLIAPAFVGLLWILVWLFLFFVIKIEVPCP